MRSPRASNFALLERRDAGLARTLQSIPPLPVTPSASGWPTMIVEGIPLHDEIDPISQAGASVRPGNPDAVLAFGLGLGYSVVEAARRAPRECWIFVFEPMLPIFRTALEHVDLSPLLGRERVKLVVGEDVQGLRGALRDWLIENQIREFYLLAHPPLERAYPSVYGPALEEAESQLNRRRTEVATLVRNSELMVRNLFANFATTARSAGVRSFAGRLRGRPGIVIAAGPSLNPCLPALKSTAGRAVRIAVGKSLRLLAAEGIAPEFVCHLDPLPECGPYFQGFEIPKETALVSDPESLPVPFAGDRITYDPPIPGLRWGTAFWGEKGRLPAGLTVAHTAFLFARELGLDPIVLVGVDLAFPGRNTHAEGVTMTWGGSADSVRPAFIEVPGVRGGMVPTMPAFRAMIHLFEEEIARTEARVVNASESGARIRGATSGAWEFPEAADLSPLSAAFAEPRPFDREAFRAGVHRLSKSLEAVEHASEQGRQALARATRTSGAPEVNRWRASILAEEELRPFLDRLFAPEMETLLAIGRRMRIAPEEERFRLDVERTEAFFRGCRRGAGVIREALAEYLR